MKLALKDSISVVAYGDTLGATIEKLTYNEIKEKSYYSIHYKEVIIDSR